MTIDEAASTAEVLEQHESNERKFLEAIMALYDPEDPKPEPKVW